MDAVKTYFAGDAAGELSYYTAIRGPQARENNKLKAKARRGGLNQETALHLETAALNAVRKYVTGKLSIEKTLDHVLAYWKALNWREDHDEASQQRLLCKQRDIYRRTPTDQPRCNCHCRVCREARGDTCLSSSRNHNKKPGRHNLHVSYSHSLYHRIPTYH